VDLGALEEGAHEHAVAEQILVELRDVLGKKPSLTPAEKEFIVTMESPWAKARNEGRKEGRDERRKEGRDEGRKEGRAEEAGRAVLAVLRVRGLVVSDAARERVLAEREPARLERWHERAILAASIADVLDEPS
jgi:flagellar biosynthesis/type III secretory pathway protein FliH